MSRESCLRSSEGCHVALLPVLIQIPFIPFSCSYASGCSLSSSLAAAQSSWPLEAM